MTSDTYAPIHPETTAWGQRALPALETLQRRVPGLLAATLCSSDGFNLCAIGLDHNQVYKMAAISSTLFAVSRSVLKEVRHEAATQEPLDMVSLTSGGLQVVGIRVEFLKERPLALLVAAQNTQIGVIMAAARAVGAEITRVLTQPAH